jgi:ribosomal protein S18 acetylase RimI-like enzyme
LDPSQEFKQVFVWAMTIDRGLNRASGTVIDNGSVGNAGVTRQKVRCLEIGRCDVRLAQVQDISQMATLLLEGFQLVPLELRWFSGMMSAGLQTDLRSRLIRPGLGQAFVAVNSMGFVMGTVEVQIQKSNFWLGTTGGVGYLSNLTVADRYRGLGVATALIKTCEDQVLAWGQSHLFLHVMSANIPARRLYLRSGYWIQSRTEDRLLLHRRLGSASIESFGGDSIVGRAS